MRTRQLHRNSTNGQEDCETFQSVILRYFRHFPAEGIKVEEKYCRKMTKIAERTIAKQAVREGAMVNVSETVRITD